MTPEEYLSSPEVLAKHTKQYRLDFGSIAAELGCHPNTVRSRTKEIQEALRQQKVADILELLGTGQSVAGAAKALGVDRSVVKEIADKQSPGKPKVPPEVRRIEAVKLSIEGHSFAKIAKSLGISPSTAYRDVKKETTLPNFPPEPDFPAEVVGQLLMQFVFGSVKGESEADTARAGEMATGIPAEKLLSVLEYHPKNYFMARRQVDLYFQGKAELSDYIAFAETSEEQRWAFECRRSVHFEVKKRAEEYGRLLNADESMEIVESMRESGVVGWL